MSAISTINGSSIWVRPAVSRMTTSWPPSFAACTARRGDIHRSLAGDDRQRRRPSPVRRAGAAAPARPDGACRARPSALSCSGASVSRLAILAEVVVLPEPCRPTIMTTTGAGAFRSMADAFGAQHVDQFVMDDLDDHLAGLDRLQNLGANRLGAYLVGEGAHDIERHVGLEQRTAHLAQGGGDISLRQRAAAGQICSGLSRGVPEGFQTSKLPCLWRMPETVMFQRRKLKPKAKKHPRAHCAVGC